MVAQGVGGDRRLRPRRVPPVAARRLRRAIVLALLAWSAVGFARATHRQHRGWAARERHVAVPALWRLGGPQPARLARCLASSLELVPEGAAVAVATTRPDLHFWRWAAYLEPGRDVLAGPSPDAPPVGYLITFGPHSPPAGERLRGGRWCALYRLAG